MELKTQEGMILISQEERDNMKVLKSKALKVRLSIIRYNKTKDENSLNSCCRNCNDIIKLLDSMFF